MPRIRHGANIPSNILVQRWRERRREILKSLSPELLAEYRQLGRSIKAVLDEEDRFAREATAAAGSFTKKATIAAAAEIDGFFPASQRVPLSVHKISLIRFLREHGPATRGEITAATNIPAGSLSTLLAGNEFAQIAHGTWSLRKVTRPAPPAE